jgi:hypothetical protein
VQKRHAHDEGQMQRHDEDEKVLISSFDAFEAGGACSTGFILGAKKLAPLRL